MHEHKCARCHKTYECNRNNPEIEHGYFTGERACEAQYKSLCSKCFSTLAKEEPKPESYRPKKQVKRRAVRRIY